MKLAVPIAAAVVALPIAALAQTSYSNATITGAPAVITAPPAVSAPLISPACADRQAVLNARKNGLDDEKLDNDRERDAIDREGMRLAGELRNLNSADVGAVAAYNERSAVHNRRVDEHNRRVADMNARAARFNEDSADLLSDCGVRIIYR